MSPLNNCFQVRASSVFMVRVHGSFFFLSVVRRKVVLRFPEYLWHACLGTVVFRIWGVGWVNLCKLSLKNSLWS